MKKILACLAALSVLGPACASGPELEKYPRREMDRPYTLPKGVANWHIPATYADVVSPGGGESTVYPVPAPLYWESSLSDDWNLLYVPIPLGVSHQFLFDKENRIGATLGMGFSYNDDEGFRLNPSLEVSYRRILSEDIAIDISPSITPSFAFKAGGSTYWSGSLEAGPWFQTDDHFGFKPSLSMDIYKGRYSKAGVAEDQYTFNGVVQTEAVIAGGAGISAVWSFARQWDFRPSYTYSGLGAKDNAHAHIATVDFVHFW